MSAPDKYLSLKGVAYLLQSRIEDISTTLSVFDEPSLDPRKNPQPTTPDVNLSKGSSVLNSFSSGSNSTSHNVSFGATISVDSPDQIPTPDAKDDDQWSNSPSPVQDSAAPLTERRNGPGHSRGGSALGGATTGRLRSDTTDSTGSVIISSTSPLLYHSHGSVVVTPLRVPSALRIYKFIRKIFDDCQLEIDCIIMSAIYIERLLSCRTFVLTPRNWRPVCLTALLLASKVWDDLSMWNIDFASLFPEFNTTKLINGWERDFLSHIDYNVAVKASTYAEYYFRLRDTESDAQVAPLDLHKAAKLEAISIGKEATAKRDHRRRAVTNDALLSPRSRAVLN